MRVSLIFVYITVERLARFEMIFFRLLHLLAHHPDFGTAEESLPDMARYDRTYIHVNEAALTDFIQSHRYIEFYLELVASPDNIPLLFYLAQKAKTVRDIESHLYSEVRQFLMSCFSTHPQIAELVRDERSGTAPHQKLR